MFRSFLYCLFPSSSLKNESKECIWSSGRKTDRCLTVAKDKGWIVGLEKPLKHYHRLASGARNPSIWKKSATRGILGSAKNKGSNSIHHLLLTSRIYDICLHSGVEFLILQFYDEAHYDCFARGETKKGVKISWQHCNLMFCRFKLHVPEFLAAFSSSSSTASSSVCCVCKIPSSWIMHWSRSSPLQFVDRARSASDSALLSFFYWASNMSFE